MSARNTSATPHARRSNCSAIWLMAAIGAAISIATSAAAQSDPVAITTDLPTRAGVTVRIMALPPAGQPRAAAILLVGGDGINRIPDNATPAWTRDGSFLIRSSTMFRDHALYTVIVDVPSESTKRTRRVPRPRGEHVADIAAVIAETRTTRAGCTSLADREQQWHRLSRERRCTSCLSGRARRARPHRDRRASHSFKSHRQDGTHVRPRRHSRAHPARSQSS